MRTRLPVTLQLLRADREGWLVTASGSSCVLLQAPVPWRPAQSSRGLAALRLLDEYWDLTVWFGSLLLISLAGWVCALVALVFPARPSCWQACSWPYSSWCWRA